MTLTDILNVLTVVIFIGFAVALGYLIAFLYRANKLLGKIDHASDSFKTFVSDVVPAIVNVGTVASAVQGLLHALHEKEKNKK